VRAHVRRQPATPRAVPLPPCSRIACSRSVVGPPPPPGPPPPGVNFTTSDGLVVGLRNSTRAVQVLGIAGDVRKCAPRCACPQLRP
jgi:hypothetical protein